MEYWNHGMMNNPFLTSDLRPLTSPARRARLGFTLVEILVVIAIISLLAGVVLLNVAPQMGLGSQAAAKSQIQVFSSAIDTYRMAHGRYPTQQQGLEALVRKPSQEPVPESYPDGGYLNGRNIPLDPWKRPYVYLCPGRQNEPFEILSYGADGEPGGSGGDADLSSVNAQ